MIRDLETKLVTVMERLVWDADAIPRRHWTFGRAQSEDHGPHGSISWKRAVHQRYPEFPVRSGRAQLEEYLPTARGKSLSGWSKTYEGAAGCCSRRLGFPIRMNFLENIFLAIESSRPGACSWLKRTRVVHREHSL